MSFLGTLVQGTRFDHSSHEISINGIPVQNVSAISWEDSLEPGEQRGTSAGKRGRTRGEYSASGSLTMYVEDFDTLVESLAPLGGGGFMEAVFPITVTVFETSSTRPSVTALRGCRITSTDQESSTGGDATEVTCQIDIMQIIRNGISAVSPRGLS